MQSLATEPYPQSALGCVEGDKSTGRRPTPVMGDARYAWDILSD